VFVLRAGVTALDPHTGQESWPVPSDDYCGYALRAGAGNVFVSTADEVIALDGSNGGRLWTHSTTPQQPPAVHGSTVYVVSDYPAGSGSSLLSALTASHGALKWASPFSNSDPHGILAADATNVYAAAGELRVWRSDGTPVRNIGAEAPITGTATDGAVVCITTVNDRLVALNISSGKAIWQQPASPALTPAVANGLVYAGTPDQSIVARRLSDGSAVWQTSGISFITPPVVVGRTVYAADRTTVYALQA
jgi:outer membrane protein assembly factor BamB